ncbi:MAG: 4'-phosphopantetheinyl transferase superfamily protein [Methylobacter sp.]|nr:4'-phosphopantetheinyl transferase superfamily protein [Methylobacter sp.]
MDYSLNTGTVEVWHGNIDVGDERYHHFWQVLDEAEQARAGRLKNELRQKRYVNAHGRLRTILAGILNEPPEKIRIKKGEHGKPYLADNPELVFNLSHSVNTMVLAVAWNCQLGIDIEVGKQRANFSALVNKCFAEEEAAYWNKLPEDQKSREFYRFWTRKEALVKAAGQGLSLGLKRCVVNPENPTEFLRVPAACGQAQAWHVKDIDLGHDICALVRDKSPISIRLVDLESLI